MAALDIVVVASGADALDDEGLDLLDLGEGGYSAAVAGGHLRPDFRWVAIGGE